MNIAFNIHIAWEMDTEKLLFCNILRKLPKESRWKEAGLLWIKLWKM